MIPSEQREDFYQAFVEGLDAVLGDKLFGVYLYGDYCSGNVWGLVHNADGSWESALLFTVRASISSFGEDETGEVYLVDLNGTIYKLVRP